MRIKAVFIKLLGHIYYSKAVFEKITIFKYLNLKSTASAEIEMTIPISQQNGSSQKYKTVQHKQRR